MKRIIWVLLFLLLAVPTFGQTQRHVGAGYIYYTTGIPAITTDFQVQGRITAGPTLNTDITNQYDIITRGCFDTVNDSVDATAGSLCSGGGVITLTSGTTGNGVTAPLTINIQNHASNYNYEAVRITVDPFMQLTQSYAGTDVSAAGTVALRNNNGVLQSSQNGAAWANLTGGGGSSYWNRVSIAGGLYALEPVTSPDDNVLLGLTATDVGQTSAIGTNGGLFSISAATAASVGGFGTIASGAVDIVSFHTPGGTTLPIQIVFDSDSASVKWTPSGGQIIGAPTGGDQGPGTLNAVGLYVQGVPVGSGGSTSQTWTFMSPYLYPVSTTETVILGATFADFMTTTQMASMLVSIKPSGTTGGITVASSSNTSANFMTMTSSTTANIFTSNFGSGGALKPFYWQMGAACTTTENTSGDWSFCTTSDLGYNLGINGTFGVTGQANFAGAVVSTDSATAAFQAIAGNGLALGLYEAFYSNVADTGLVFDANVSSTRAQVAVLDSTGLYIQRSSGAGGSLVVSNPTGGSQGEGSVNAKAYYVNGVEIATGNIGGSGTIGTMPYFSGTATLANSPLVVSGGNLTTGVSIISTANTSTPAFTVSPGNGIAFGLYESITNDVADTGMGFDANVSGSRAQVAVLNGTGLAISRSSGAGGSLLISNATGGFQGEGTINAKAYYVNGSLLSSGIGGSGTTGNFTGFSGSTTITNAPMTFSGTAVSIAGSLTSTDTATAAFTVASGNGINFGSYEAITNDAGDTELQFYVNNSSTQAVNAKLAWNNFVFGESATTDDSDGHPTFTVVGDGITGRFLATSAASNASYMEMAISGSFGLLDTGHTGSGTALPMELFAGNTEGIAIATNGTITMPNLANSVGSYYACLSGGMELLWSTTPCGTNSDEMAGLRSQIDALTQRLDALTNQAVATKKEQQ